MRAKKPKALDDGPQKPEEVPKHIGDQVKAAARLLADTLSPPPDVPTADQLVAGLHSASEAENDPIKKERLRNAVNMIQESIRRELVETWPDLFRLYRHPSGALEAELDGGLQQRKTRLEAGVMPTEESIFAIQEAMIAILFASMQLQQELPHIKDIPEPKIDTDGSSNLLEIHRAALDLHYRASPACIVLNMLQRSFGPRLKELTEVGSERRLVLSEQLKKDFGCAIDKFATGDRMATYHGNRHVEEASKLPSLTAIEAARLLVEENQSLPTKHDIRVRAEHMCPLIAEFSARQWTRILNEAGLNSLPRKKSWR